METREHIEYEQDTIAAIATALGDGGIAIIRISGPNSLGILEKVFVSSGASTNKSSMDTHHLYHGHIKNYETNEILDETLCTIMKSPNSYTGEDMAEIHSHGGRLVPNKILELLFKSGARPANAGEFTLRAYLNGKMDLTQAEAVTDIINAQTDEGLKQAELQLEGALSNKIGQYKDTLADILAEIEAQVDFPEEDIDPITKNRLLDKSKALLLSISDLVETYDEGQIIKNGVSTAIVGKPNAGKSSLLNQLLNKDRAIVSSTPGTTRDFIEELVDVRGIALILADTAGIRSSEDEIENIGVELAKKKAKEAELIIVVIDSSTELNNDDIEILETIKGKKAVLALNKSDIESKTSKNDLKLYITQDLIVKTSAKEGTGIEELKDKVKAILITDASRTETSEIVLTELRHKLALEKCLQNLTSFLESIEREESLEFLALDIRVALDALGEITGEVTTEDILGRIFSKFCIGK